jgi:hypothetical protein
MKEKKYSFETIKDKRYITFKDNEGDVIASYEIFDYEEKLKQLHG